MSCDPSLDPSRREGSNDGSQNMFCMEKYCQLSLNSSCYPFLSGALVTRLWEEDVPIMPLFTNVFSLTGH